MAEPTYSHRVRCQNGHEFEFGVQRVTRNIGDRTVIADHEATGSTVCPQCGVATGHVTVSIEAVSQGVS